MLTKSGTWEPEENLAETGLIGPWKRSKELMGARTFRKVIEGNQAQFDIAVRRHREEKAIRKQKREKKRAMLKRRAKPRVESSEEDVPLVQQMRAGQSKTTVAAEDLPASQSSYYKNFVDSQDPSPLPPPTPTKQTGSGLFVEEIPAGRKAPLEQSTSEEEENSSVNDDSDDSLMGELAVEAKRSKPNLGRSILSRKSPQKKTTSPAKSGPEPTRKQMLPGARRQEEPPKLSRRPTAPAATTLSKDTESKKKLVKPSVEVAQSASAAPRRKSTSFITALSMAGTATATAHANMPKSAGPVPTKTPLKPPSSTAIRKTGGTSRAAPIKMINGPKPAPRVWLHGDKQYKTTSFRRKAELRSRVEGTPDPSALEFVGGKPVGEVLPKTATRAENPYGRREAGNRRMQETDNDEPLRRDVIEGAVPLQPYEISKAPLVCYEWRMSRNCRYGPERCNFMHRNKDERGIDLPVAKFNYLPPKYREKPMTCPYWLYTNHGCSKPEKDCDFAHHNTGWAPKDENNIQEAIKIDPNIAPVFEVATRRPFHPTANGPAGKRKMHPSQLTCWYWVHSTCRNTAEVCAYQHYDTGVVADGPPRTTCRDWREGTCPFTADTCKYMHSEVEDTSGRLGAISGSRTLQTHNNDVLTHKGSNAVPLRGAPQRGHFGVTAPHHKRQSVDEFDTFDAVAPQKSLELTQPHSPTLLSAPMSASTHHAYAPPPPPPPPLTVLAPAGTSCQELNKTIEQALQIEFADVFEWGENEKGKIMLDRRAMLLYHPEDHCKELEVITRWLLMHHVEVSSVFQDGCWDYFRQQTTKGRSGVIIVSRH